MEASFNSQELATAAQYGINVVVVVFNDNAFGNVLRDQTVRLKGRLIGTELHNPDFVKLAEAYGAIGLRAKDPFDVQNVIPRALDIKKPVFIDVPVSRVPRPKQWAARAPWTKPQDGLID